MEEVIKKIIEIEDIAKDIMDTTVAEKEQKEKEHVQQLKALEDKIVSDAKKKVEQIREREFLEIKEHEEEKVRLCEERLVKMDSEAAKKMDVWVKELVDRVLS